jgi:hypothetical protein
MKLVRNDQNRNEIEIDFTKEEIVRIAALMREGTEPSPFPAFITRVGWSEEEISNLANELHTLLYSRGIPQGL